MHIVSSRCQAEQRNVIGVLNGDAQNFIFDLGRYVDPRNFIRNTKLQLHFVF